MNIKEKLTNAGIIPSRYRIAIYNYLLETKIHPTADIIYASVKDFYPHIALATVYNVLQALQESDLIHAMHIGKEKVHYDADISFHSHFYCNQCQSIHDILIPQSSPDNILYPQITHRIERTEIIYSGTCKDCLK